MSSSACHWSTQAFDQIWYGTCSFRTYQGSSSSSFATTAQSASMRASRLLRTSTKVCSTSLNKSLKARQPFRQFTSTVHQTVAMTTGARVNGDLNNTEVLRSTAEIPVDRAYLGKTLAVTEEEDDHEIRHRCRQGFLLNDAITKTDWISKLELSTVLKLSEKSLIESHNDRIRVLVLYGSLRSRSYSRLLAYEAARILHRLGCDVRIYDPTGLPVKDDTQHNHHKVQELRELSKWSDGHVWVSPEQHGNLTAVFKNQIDWIPLSSGSVRPTQGRTLAIAQVSGGSQSFNTVNSLRMLGRWMRMFAIPNQSSVPKAYTQFTDAVEVGDEANEGGSRLMASGNRDRLVDCMEEFVKYTIVMRPHFELFGDRFSEREEREQKREKARSDQAKEKEKAGLEGNATSIVGSTNGVVNGIDVNGI